MVERRVVVQKDADLQLARAEDAVLLLTGGSPYFLACEDTGRRARLLSASQVRPPPPPGRRLLTKRQSLLARWAGQM